MNNIPYFGVHITIAIRLVRLIRYERPLINVDAHSLTYE